MDGDSQSSGPKPWDDDARSGPPCANCGSSTSKSAGFCEACGEATGRASAPPAKVPDVECPGCGISNLDDAAFCGNCGSSLPGSAYSDNTIDTANPATSSSGRQPDTSLAARRRYLDALTDRRTPSLGDLDHRDIFHRVGDAERLVEATEQDWTEAHGRAVVSRAQAPEMAHARHLSPEARHQWMVAQNDAAAEEEAHRAYTTARQKLARELEVLEAVSRPDLGLPPGRDPLDPDREYES